MIFHSVCTGRTFSTSRIQREVIQAHGHRGSNQNCTSCVNGDCSVMPGATLSPGGLFPGGPGRPARCWSTLKPDMPYFDGVTGRVYYRAWRAPAPRTAAVVFLHGFGEHSGLYHRLGDALTGAGIDLWALDEIGHGL